MTNQTQAKETVLVKDETPKTTEELLARIAELEELVIKLSAKKKASTGSGRKAMLVYLDDDKAGSKMSDMKITDMRNAKKIVCTTELSAAVSKYLTDKKLIDKVVIDIKRIDKK
jgi:hypothetical protein